MRRQGRADEKPDVDLEPDLREDEVRWEHVAAGTGMRRGGARAGGLRGEVTSTFSLKRSSQEKMEVKV